MSEVRKFKVATFYTSKPGRRPVLSRLSAYTRDFNADWPGCVVYQVRARNGTEAKLEARKRRLSDELRKLDSGGHGGIDEHEERSGLLPD